MRIFAAVTAFALAFAFHAAEARTWRIESGQAQALAQAFAQAESGDTIRIDGGQYDLGRGLALRADGVEVRGAGAENTILSFASQNSAEPGLIVRGDGVRLEGFAVSNAHGDAIAAEHCADLRVKDMKLDWSAYASMGASGLRVVNCNNVSIDGLTATDASEAGVLLEGVRAAIVTRVNVQGNFVGLAVLNSISVDATENQLSHNGVGAAILSTPGGALETHDIRLFRNDITENDGADGQGQRAEFADLPSAIGVVAMGARNVHIYENAIANHGTTHVLVTSWPGSARGDANYNPLSRDVMIRDNRFGAAGDAPRGALAAIAASGVVLPDVIWDGADTYYSATGPRSDVVRVVMRDNRSTRTRRTGSFLNLGLTAAGMPFSEAAPNPAFPPLVDLAEPERVRLP